MSEPTVRISGILLASLMFQHVNSDEDVEGLILGESRFEEQVTISDSQADHIHIDEIYNVQKLLAAHRLNTVYCSTGQVNLDSLQKLLADNKQESVIGWYRQRRNTEHQVTFRERLVHENLKNLLSNPQLIFMLLTPTELTPPGSTHRMEYSAHISHSRRFLSVPVLVSNLGLLEPQAYWKVSAPCSAAGYNLAMTKHGSRFFSSNGLLKEVNEVNEMNESLQAELQTACSGVEQSERRMEALQTEVSALRRKLQQKQRRKETTGIIRPPEQRNNHLLHDALAALFGRSPLFNTQTLTLQGFPVPEEDISTTTQVNSGETPQPPQDVKTCQKRLQQSLSGRERKRRRSQS